MRVSDGPSRTSLLRPRLLLALLAALTLVIGGCDNCGGADKDQKAQPASPEARREAMTSMLPSSTSSALIISDLAGFRDVAGTIKARLGDVVPLADMPQRQVKEYLGIDALKADSWESAGIDPDGALTIATVDSHPVLLTYTSDKKKFESYVAEQAKETLGIDASPSSKSVGDHDFKMLSKSPDQQLAWAWDGSLAVVVFPAAQTGGDAAPTVTKTVGTVLDQKADGSMYKTSGFQKFMKVAADNPAVLYANTTAIIESTPVQQLSQMPAQKRIVERARETLDGMGLILEPVDVGVRARVWFGASDKVAKEAMQMWQEIPEGNWENLATDQTLAAFRVSTDWATAWKRATAQDTPQVQAARRMLKRAGDQLGADIEKELISHLTGHLGVFFYGMGPDFSQSGLMMDPVGQLRHLGLVAATEFDSTEAPLKFARKLVEKFPPLSIEQLKEEAGEAGEPIYAIRWGAGEKTGNEDGEQKRRASLPVDIYLHGPTLAACTQAIGTEAMVKYLTGSREESASLADASGMPLGARFASESKVSGLYLNFKRARDHLGNRLPPFPPLQNFIQGVQEIMLGWKVTDGGTFMDLTMHLTNVTSE